MKRRIERNERTNRNQRLIRENKRNAKDKRLMKEYKNEFDFMYTDDIYFVIDDPKDLNYAGIVYDVVIDDKHFITTEEPEHGQYNEGEARDKVVYWIVENMKDDPIFDNIYTFDNLLSFYDEDDFRDMSDFGDWIYDNYEVCCETNYFIPDEKFGVIEDITQEVRREVRNNLEGSKFIEKLKEQFGIDEDEKVNFNESKRIKNRRMIKENISEFEKNGIKDFDFCNAKWGFNESDYVIYLHGVRDGFVATMKYYGMANDKYSYADMLKDMDSELVEFDTMK